MSECRGCRAGVEHCHGTLIHHALRGAECTEEGCVSPDVMHVLRVDCESIGCACAQPIGSADWSASSTG